MMVFGWFILALAVLHIDADAGKLTLSSVSVSFCSAIHFVRHTMTSGVNVIATRNQHIHKTSPHPFYRIPSLS